MVTIYYRKKIHRKISKGKKHKVTRVFMNLSHKDSFNSFSIK